GNVFLKQADIDVPLEDPASGDEVLKAVFIVFFQGDQLKSRVKKICEGFRASLYPCPDSQAERREMAISVMTRIEDLNTVLNTTVDHRRRLLMSAAKNLRLWFIKVGKIKAIYHTLNMFNVEATSKCLIGEAWCASSTVYSVLMCAQATVSSATVPGRPSRRGTERAGSSVPPILNRMTTREAPPTYFRVNKLTVGFQNIIDAYGVASYREANPTPFAVITFPFLFAVMYGDFGHGALMFLAALWMVLRERQLAPTTKASEIWATFFNGRYIILLMGLFSVYTGLIYNDVFSHSVNIFGSGWSVKGQFSNMSIDQVAVELRKHESLQLNPNSSDAKAWQGNPYPRDFLSVIGEFVPQLLFMMAMFGYLVILIVYKWIAYSGQNSNCAPNLLIGLINMFLVKYQDPPENCDVIYHGYKPVQIVLLLLIVICVPWMLLTKPLVLRARHKNRQHQHQLRGPPAATPVGDQTEVTHHQTVDMAGQHGAEEEEEFDIGEIFVHQTIHTIEYCLGCISNTASYLRLWALSLAHAQLSEVLWTMVLAIGLKQEGFVGSVMLFFVFFFWAVLTVCVLLLMEGLSAFLHALRLHWVEFMNKFYQGEGHKFEPFNFNSVEPDA
uniref:V-type proton ATPase subunit a n=1 Tax=Macrostomum lignano TaxID=282301 RepID=A0A1I8IWJ6_9PLAT